MKPNNNLPISEAITDFRHQFYPDLDESQWQSWKWQLQHRIDSLSRLSGFLEPTAIEKEAFQAGFRRIPFSITPYYMGVITRLNQDGTLRKSVVPTAHEFNTDPGESRDPLTEAAHSPVPAIVHRYPDRVLFLATSQCAVYCRYCTRARIFDQPAPSLNRTRHWQAGIDYIQGNRSIREVIISGGDPLMLDDAILGELMEKLRQITHVQILRLGTKIPVVLPQRITTELVNMLGKFHPLILSLHVNHPDELTAETAAALERLVNAGIVIGSQTVLLKGLNDNPAVMQHLMEKLLKLRVRPYALFQCDPVMGSGHFRTTLEKGIEIIETLRSRTSGYAIPHYIVDPPGGKVNLAPASLISKEGPVYRLRNWQGMEIDYKDPAR